MARRVPKSISFSPEALRAVDRMAVATGQNRSEVVCQLVLSVAREGEAMTKLLIQPHVRLAFSNAMLSPGVLRAMGDALGEKLTPEQRRTLFDDLKAEAVREAAGPGEVGRRRKGGK